MAWHAAVRNTNIANDRQYYNDDIANAAPLVIVRTVILAILSHINATI